LFRQRVGYLVLAYDQLAHEDFPQFAATFRLVGERYVELLFGDKAMSDEKPAHFLA
jgi:hypothetical protein